MEQFKVINWIIYPPDLILLDIHIPQLFYYTENHINHIISAENIVHGLMNINTMYHMSKIIHPGI